MGAPENSVIIWKNFKILHAESNMPGLIGVTATFMAQYHGHTYLNLQHGICIANNRNNMEAGLPSIAT